MLDSFKYFIALLILIFPLSSESWGETPLPYKSFVDAMIFGESSSIKDTLMTAEPPVPDRIVSLNTIVIDPGHGGDDPGATGPTGLKEKEVTLKTARALKKLLQTGLGSQVFLTREADSGLPPEQRAGMANGFKADLFISIHTAASSEKNMKGVGIFLPDDSGDLTRTSDRLQTRESSGGRANNDIIPWDTVHLKYLPMSRLLGRLIQLNLVREMNRDVTISELPLLTLRGVNMPALELEVGYITSLSTETELKDDAYIYRLVTAVYKGIKQYKETLMLAGRQP